MALEAGDARHADEADDDHLGRAVSLASSAGPSGRGTRPARRAASASPSASGSLVAGVHGAASAPRPRRPRSPGSGRALASADRLDLALEGSAAVSIATSAAASARAAASAATSARGAASAAAWIAANAASRSTGVTRRLDVLELRRGPRARPVASVDALGAVASALRRSRRRLGVSAASASRSLDGVSVSTASAAPASTRLGGSSATSAASKALGQDVLEGRRLGQVLGHRREAGRILLGEEPLEERRHLALEAADRRLDVLDLALDAARHAASISVSRSALRA